MNQLFKSVKILIWDIDGTLYKMLPEIKALYREREYQVIMAHLGWPREKAVAKFLKMYPKLISGTKTVSVITGIPTKDVAIEAETLMTREKYLKSDVRLIQLFEQLHKFTHYLLVNGIQSVTQKTLKILGLNPQIFQEIVTSEIVGENKPNPAGFQYILDKTKLPPKSHLMIGDREEVDLVPARQLGMKTCLVWSEKKSNIADVTIKTVYEIADFLGF